MKGSVQEQLQELLFPMLLLTTTVLASHLVYSLPLVRWSYKEKLPGTEASQDCALPREQAM
jgi:hypothetical protein